MEVCSNVSSTSRRRTCTGSSGPDSNERTAWRPVPGPPGTGDIGMKRTRPLGMQVSRIHWWK